MLYHLSSIVMNIGLMALSFILVNYAMVLEDILLVINCSFRLI